MRFIKFRAWDPIVQRMYFYTMNDLCHNSNRPDLYIYEWQEWTGIQDEYGVDIYEGDILEFEMVDTVGCSHFHRGECKFMPLLCGFQVVVSHERQAYITPDKNMKVVGNIHETPSLLTKNKPTI